MAHEQDWVRDEYADLWLGFDGSELMAKAEQLDLENLEVDQLPGATPELPVLMMTGTKRSAR